MLISRGFPVLRAFSRLTQNKANFKQIARNSGHGAAWVYRRPPNPPSKYYFVVAEMVQGFMWWWMLWHLWTEPEHITGEFEWPDASKWTDAELGIPDELKLDE